MNFAFEQTKDKALPQAGVSVAAPGILWDEALPQLAVVRDVSIMRDALQLALFGEGARCRIEHCIVAFIRYRPGKNCLIHYRMIVRDTATDEERVERLAAKVLPPGLSQGLFLEEQKKALLPSSQPCPLHHLPDLGMVVWLFPNDPKLDGLPALVDDRRLESFVLPQLAGEVPGPDWQLLQWHKEVVSYVPERRCTLRITAQLQHRITGELKAQTFYGKAYPDHGGRTTRRNMKNLRANHCGRFAPFRVARPLLYEEESKILWQTGLAGTPLTAFRAGSPELLRLLENAARGISALHTSNLECAGMAQQSNPLESLERACILLSDRGIRCADLVDRLFDAARSLKDSPSGTVHGDLHLDNVFSTESGIGFIDLDSLAWGDPIRDLSGFLANLCTWSVMRGLDSDQVETMVRAVVLPYIKAVPWDVTETEVRFHLAAALIYHQAQRCIAKPQEWRLAILEDLIRLAERIQQRGIL